MNLCVLLYTAPQSTLHSEIIQKWLQEIDCITSALGEFDIHFQWLHVRLLYNSQNPSISNTNNAFLCFAQKIILLEKYNNTVIPPFTRLLASRCSNEVMWCVYEWCWLCVCEQGVYRAISEITVIRLSGKPKLSWWSEGLIIRYM